MIHFEALDSAFFTRYGFGGMEQHPIPQNVTAFEFHLVGDMTLKQFGYLAGGLIIAYFTYVLIFPLSAIIASPIIVLSALSGAAFAFLPILDRPLDHWVGAYFKAVYSASGGTWKDPFNPKKRVESNDPGFKNRLKNYLAYLTPASFAPLQVLPPIQPTSLPMPTSFPLHPLFQPSLPTPSTPVPKKLDLSKITPPAVSYKPVLTQVPSPSFQTPFPSIPPVLAKPQNPQPLPPPLSSHLPSPQELNKLIAVAKQAQLLQARIVEIERELSWLKTSRFPPASAPTAAPVDAIKIEAQEKAPANKFQQMVGSLQGLIKQTEELHRESEVITKHLPHPHSQNVVIVKPEQPPTPQPTLTTTPNVINGIVTDSTGNYLEGAIVIIHNKADLPVRALKTNKLGQFAGATPLSDGTYNLTLEKDNLEFDTLQLALEGKTLPPLLIHAKKGVVNG
ncbi:MAG: hypothetical protein UU29_C0009G0040 [Candidatus Daviesbacteria bacterium GW2011_GWA2_40_9]|uniref:Uncharacterized protein n=1 Tax=Candidatus Daviesbacteria bacterium GW2011_GWA2_40_9 TaxID=1618424 RepID=A0A0G0U0X3_9BACT|nr:MAG: hypothetical protein UU29_C0009G0040 [Candidatus Daviesbacteria bacterium GW2011_GWA2_40_9]